MGKARVHTSFRSPGLHLRARVRGGEVTPACRPPLTHARTVESPVRPVWTGRVFMCSRDVVTLLRLARVCVCVSCQCVCVRVMMCWKKPVSCLFWLCVEISNT